MAKGGFRGGFPGGNQMNMMKQAQKMQQDFLKMQEELESSKFEFTAGGGAVKACLFFFFECHNFYPFLFDFDFRFCLQEP